MALSARVKSLDRIRKVLAVEIVATHKTARTGGVLDTASLLVTDARFLIDPAGPSFYQARLMPGYRRVRSTGTESGTDSLLGTGVGPGTVPNRLTFSVFAGEDRDGLNLRDWQDYQLKGAQVIARMGAVHDELGAAVDFADFEEEFFGYLDQVPRTGADVWQFVAVSPEGYRQDSPLVRRTYRGLGYGAQLDNSATAPLANADAWLSGTAGNALAPTAGAYSWGAIIAVPNLPSATGVDGGLFNLSVGGVSRLSAWITTAADRIDVFHHDGAASTSVEFDGWNLSEIVSETPFRIGVRYDGSAMVHLYIGGVLVDSKAMTRDVAADAVDVDIGRLTATSSPLDVIVYELWVGNADVGDEVFRQRMSGPLRGDVQNQGDLWIWHEFIEGGRLVKPTTTADLQYECNLTLGGTAAFVSSREGDHPDTSPMPQGLTLPHVIGKNYNATAVPLESAEAISEVARDGAAANFARLDGVPAQLAYSRTGNWALTQTPVDGIEDDTLAGLVIARDDTTGQQGSEVEIFGDAGGPTCDGTYEVLSVSQGRYIGLGTPIGYPVADMTGMPREDRTATCEVTIPRYVTGRGDAAWGETLDAGPAVNNGGGLVGLPATAHGLDAAITRIKVVGSTNYSATTYHLDASTSVDELVIAETYIAETFGGTEAVTASVAQVTDLGDGRVRADSLPTAKLTLDVTGTEAAPGLRETYTHLRNARDRAETEQIVDASFVLDENFVVTWVGANGERSQLFSLVIPAGQDLAYREALGKLLRSYFTWSSDNARTLVESTQFPEVRMGHFAAPATGGTSFHGRLVTSQQIEELSSEPPAWRLTATYRPNYTPTASTPTGIPPAVREQLAAQHSEIEIARDEATRADRDNARDIIWETNFWAPEVAALVGQRVWDWIKVDRLFRRWEMALLPEEVDTGADFTIEGGSHDELAPSADAYFFPATIEDGITTRGVVLIAAS